MKKQTTNTKKTYATHITGADGRRVYVKASSKAELERKVLQKKMEMSAGVDIADSTSFREFAYLWLATYKSGLRENSLATLKGNLESHIIPVLGDSALRDIKPLHIQAWLKSIRGMSTSVQRKCIQAVRAIFNAAAENGLILKSPVSKEDKAQGLEAKDEEALTDGQARSLLEAVKGTRAYLFCLLALTTGMRRGEILGLMWEDVDLESGIITVTHNKTFPSNKADAPVTELLKSEAAHRRLPIPLVLRHALEQELRDRSTASPYVLHMADGRSLTKNSFSSLWAIVTARTAGEGRELGSWVRGSNGGRLQVTLDFTCHPHLLRHTYITQLFEAGLDLKQVQYLAGHATPDITLRVYTHYRRKSREQETFAQVMAATAYLAGGNVIPFPGASAGRCEGSGEAVRQA